MIVEKKSVQFVDEKEHKESSMMVSQKVAEDKLYNLMRGHTSLMIAADSDSSEDEGEEGSEDDENNESSEAVPDERKKEEVSQRLFGLSLPEFGSRVFNERGVPLTWKACSVEDTRRKQKEEWDYYQCPTGKYLQSKEYLQRQLLQRKHRPPTPEITEEDIKKKKEEDVPEEKQRALMTSPASRDPDWPALPKGAPTWGNSQSLNWRDEEEGANEWRDSGRSSKRKARDNGEKITY